MAETSRKMIRIPCLYFKGVVHEVEATDAGFWADVYRQEDQCEEQYKAWQQSLPIEEIVQAVSVSQILTVAKVGHGKR